MKRTQSNPFFPLRGEWRGYTSTPHGTPSDKGWGLGTPDSYKRLTRHISSFPYVSTRKVTPEINQGNGSDRCGRSHCTRGMWGIGWWGNRCSYTMGVCLAASWCIVWRACHPDSLEWLTVCCSIRDLAKVLSTVCVLRVQYSSGIKLMIHASLEQILTLFQYTLFVLYLIEGDASFPIINMNNVKHVANKVIRGFLEQIFAWFSYTYFLCILLRVMHGLI